MTIVSHLSSPRGSVEYYGRGMVGGRGETVMKWRSHTDDGDIVLGSLELPEGNIDSDTTLTLGLQFVENPGVLEGALTQLGGFLRTL